MSNRKSTQRYSAAIAPAKIGEIKVDVDGNSFVLTIGPSRNAQSVRVPLDQPPNYTPNTWWSIAPYYVMVQYDADNVDYWVAAALDGPNLYAAEMQLDESGEPEHVTLTDFIRKESKNCIYNGGVWTCERIDFQG